MSREALHAQFGPQAVADELYAKLSPMFYLSEVTIPEPQVIPTDDPTYADRFPAAFDGDGETGLKMFYHRQAIDELSESYDPENPALFDTLERVYLAGGLVTGAVFNQVSQMDSDSLNRLYDTLLDVDPICDIIRDERGQDADQKTAQMASLMQSDAERRVAIGLQRLCLGVYGLVSEESESFKLLQKFAHEDMLRGIRDYRNSLTIFRAGGAREIDAELKAGQRFKDAVTEMTWALCYPMGPEEIRRIFKLCQERPFHQPQVFDQRDLRGRGFSIE